MATVIIEQFNPKSGCWNKIAEVDRDEYDPAAPVENRYNGPYRTRVVGEEVSVEEFFGEAEDEIPEEILRETIKEVAEHSFFDWKEE